MTCGILMSAPTCEVVARVLLAASQTTMSCDC